MKVKANNPVVTVQGQVVHRVELNWDELRNQIRQTCQAHLGNGATQQEIDNCVNEALLNIIRYL